MKIWLDSSRTESPRSALCSGACAPPPHLLMVPHTSQTEENLMVQGLRIQQSTPLHIQQCGEEQWLVCNPVGAEQVVVLDAEAMKLFEQFQMPIIASQVIGAPFEELFEAKAEVIALLLQVGLLQDLDAFTPDYATYEPQTLAAWLHVTNACNLRCPYCFLDKTSEPMSNDTGRQAIDAIFRSALKHGMQRIRLKYAGGEPSLHMQHVIELHDYASRLAEQHNIILDDILLSNGVMLSQRAVDNLKARQIKVMISLDGIGTYHDSQRPFINGQGSFRYVDRTIARLLASDLAPLISITVSQRNLDGLVNLVNYVLERNLPFNFHYYIDNECSSQIADLQFAEECMISTMLSAFQVIEQRLPQINFQGALVDLADMSVRHNSTCGVGKNYLVIDQDGGIAKCPIQIKETVTTIYDEDPLQTVKNDRKGIQGLLVDQKEGCRTCDWRYWCTGGCPLLTYRATGRYDVKSPNCHIYKALFPAALRLEALRLLQYEQPLVLC